MNAGEDVAVALADASPDELAAELRSRCRGRRRGERFSLVPDGRLVLEVQARWREVGARMGAR